MYCIWEGCWKTVLLGEYPYWVNWVGDRVKFWLTTKFGWVGDETIAGLYTPDVFIWLTKFGWVGDETIAWLYTPDVFIWLTKLVWVGDPTNAELKIPDVFVPPNYRLGEGEKFPDNLFGFIIFRFMNSFDILIK